MKEENQNTPPKTLKSIWNKIELSVLTQRYDQWSCMYYLRHLIVILLHLNFAPNSMRRVWCLHLLCTSWQTICWWSAKKTGAMALPFKSLHWLSRFFAWQWVQSVGIVSKSNWAEMQEGVGNHVRKLNQLWCHRLPGKSCIQSVSRFVPNKFHQFCQNWPARSACQQIDVRHQFWSSTGSH